VSIARRDIFHGMPIEQPRTMGERVKREREARQMTQTELAKAAGITQPTLSVIESGRTKNVEDETLLGLANALGVTARYLRHGRVASVPQTGISGIDAVVEIYDALTPENRAAWLAAGRAFMGNQPTQQRPPKPPKGSPPSGRALNAQSAARKRRRPYPQ
jgi:transcriptional regulator with XRE-family HTH domain